MTRCPHRSKLIPEQQGPLSIRPPLQWASWELTHRYLPATFHASKGKGLFSELVQWLLHEPVTTLTNKLASYQTIEIVALSIGLAMRDLAAIQFQENSILPTHLVNSPLEFRQWCSTLFSAEDLPESFQNWSLPRPMFSLYSPCNMINSGQSEHRF